MQEDNRTEFKRQLNDKLEREVVAFLNYREGGDIYIGIDDDGSVVGADDSDEVQLAAADRIKNNILPSTLGLFDIVIEKYDGKKVVHIIISSGAEKPYYIRRSGMSPQGCFIRVGSAAQPMSTNMIDELYSKRTRNSLGKIASPRSRLTFEQLQIYYQERGLTLNEKFAENLELLTEDGKFNYAAYLLSDDNGMTIKIAKYSGKDKVDLIESNEYGYCSLIKATKNVLNRLEIENTTLAKITSRERIEKRIVNPIALREAVINAIVHNDYTREVPPVFEIFSNRVQITSYGGLPDGLSREDFFKCRSISRNRELMRVFKDIGLVEQLGSGMSRILAAYDESVFEISENFVVVTFMFAKENGRNIGDKKTADKKPPIKTAQNIEKIIEYLRVNETAKTTELCEIIRLSERRTREILKIMTDDGIIEIIGGNKNRIYKLK